MKKLSILLVLIIVLSLLCGCGKKGGYATPEDAVKAFIQSTTGDEELFKSSVHPNMLEYLMQIFFYPGAEIRINKIFVKSSTDILGDKLADKQQDYQDDFGIKVTKASIVKVLVNYYDYRECEEQAIEHDVLALYVDGAWYACGWS